MVLELRPGDVGVAAFVDDEADRLRRRRQERRPPQRLERSREFPERSLRAGRSLPRVEAQEGADRVGIPLDRGPEGRGRALPHLRKKLEDALEGRLLLRVHEEAQVREDVLHVLLLEEAQPRADLVRDAATRQLDLQLEGLMVGAVEDGDLGQRGPLVAQLEDALGHEIGLLRDVGRAHDGDRHAGGARRDEGFFEAPRVPRDGRVREPENLRRRPVVRLEREDARPRMALGEPEKRLEVRSSKRVDGLRVVADDHDVRRLDVLDDEIHEVRLQAVDVLVLVHEDVPEARAEAFPDHGVFSSMSLFQFRSRSS